MSDVWSEFKFQVGDLVIHRCLPKRSVMWSREGAAAPLVVIGQTLDRCSGGVQRTYATSTLLDGRNAAIEKMTCSYHECELEAYTPPPAKE